LSNAAVKFASSVSALFVFSAVYAGGAPLFGLLSYHDVGLLLLLSLFWVGGMLGVTLALNRAGMAWVELNARLQVWVLDCLMSTKDNANAGQDMELLWKLLCFSTRLNFQPQSQKYTDTSLYLLGRFLCVPSAFSIEMVLLCH
jgi:hypothetical protein